MARKKIGQTRSTPTSGLRNQRLEKRVNFLRCAVVRMESNVYIVAVGDSVRVFSERNRAKNGVFQIPRSVLASPRRNLHYAITAGLNKTLNGRIERIRVRNIDGGVCVLTGVRFVEHLTIALEVNNGHIILSFYAFKSDLQIKT